MRNGARGGASAVKITDVAAAAGVAPMTVSRVINTPDRVSPETTAKVRAAIQKLGYVPNLMAGGLSSRRTRMVGAIVPTIAHPMFSGLVQAFTDAMRAEGYQVLLALSGYGNHYDEEMVRTLLGRRPDAILITGAAYAPSAWQMLMEAGIPLVEVWERTPRPIDMVVGFDHAELGASVADFFLAKGHDRFACVFAGDSRAQTRMRGFADRVREAGGVMLRADTVPAPSTIQLGREFMRALAPRLDKRTALFAGSDQLAFGALTEARHWGIDVPTRLAVCGFGNYELSWSAEPPFTTVNIEGPATGHAAAEMLLRRLAGETTPEPERRAVPYAVLERATT